MRFCFDHVSSNVCACVSLTLGFRGFEGYLGESMASGRDIPGYYYDEEKKRYFRAPPKHLAYICSDHVGDPTHHTTKGKKTTKDTTSTRAPSRYNGRPVARGTITAPTSVYRLTSRLSTCLDPASLRQTLPQTLVCSSRSVGNTPVENSSVSEIQLNRSGDLVAVCLTRQNGERAVVINQLSLSPAKRVLQLLPVPRGHIILRNKSVGGTHVAIASPGIITDTVAVRDHDMVEACTYARQREVAKGDSLWHVAQRTRSLLTGCVDYDKVLCCLSSGSGVAMCAVPVSNMQVCKVYIRRLHDMKILSMYTLRTEKILSLTFRASPLLLYAGTRSGIVTSWDLRTKSRASTITIKRERKTRPSVIQLHAIDDDYLVTSCMDSRLLLWDCRMNRQVLSYSEHCNSHYWCQSVVDESQSFVAAVGEDKSIRVWSVWAGVLRRCIPTSEYVSDEAVLDGVFPAIAHTDRLGGIDGVRALLIGTPQGITSFML